MFGRKKVVVEATMEQVEVVARPEPEMQEVAPEGYGELALKIGLVTTATMKDFLQREEIPVYSLAKVSRFMDSLVDPDNDDREGRLMWCWMPLRSGDRRENSSAWWTNGSVWNKNIYQKPVPMDTLKLVARISDVFPDARFLVADRLRLHRRENIGGDPFLGVQTVQGEIIPIACWDEPGFSTFK